MTTDSALICITSRSRSVNYQSSLYRGLISKLRSTEAAAYLWSGGLPEFFENYAQIGAFIAYQRARFHAKSCQIAKTYREFLKTTNGMMSILDTR